MKVQRDYRWADIRPQTELAAGKALRVLPAQPPTPRYIYAGGKRYRVTDANFVVDGLFENGRPGHVIG